MRRSELCRTGMVCRRPKSAATGHSSALSGGLGGFGGAGERQEPDPPRALVTPPRLPAFCVTFDAGASRSEKPASKGAALH